jgi:hypothetical protein
MTKWLLAEVSHWYKGDFSVHQGLQDCGIVGHDGVNLTENEINQRP